MVQGKWQIIKNNVRERKTEADTETNRQRETGTQTDRDREIETETETEASTDVYVARLASLDKRSLFGARKARKMKGSRRVYE